MTLISQDANFKPGDVAEYNEREDKDVLVQITRVRDMEKRREPFTMKKDGEMRVYALGEGRDGEMFDYAWIEEANTGKVIWEMTYRKTGHAGGDQKNREFNDTVYLKVGDYVLRYESDDSHSFRDWNSSPPRPGELGRHNLQNWQLSRIIPPLQTVIMPSKMQLKLDLAAFFL